jgi:hypothetical protein
VDLIRSYGDALCPRSEAKADFNRLCAGATEKTLQSILGEKSAGSFIQGLEKYASFKIQDIGDKPEFLVKCIKEVCGPSSDVIEDFIVKELKDKIQVKVK